ncbi:MAG: hypothetical protein HW411_1593 [Gammaproteobacteria bacterium]|nr:hypothetical protein [Gammaproteobacteria bacterium]
MIDTMKQFFVTVSLLSIMLLNQAMAEEPDTATQEDDIEQEAMASLMRMATFLSGAQQLSVTIDAGHDAVQRWGQKIEFGAVRHVTIRRPDRVRVDVVNRDGSQSGVRFNSKEISVFSVDDKVYATDLKPGSADSAMEHLVEKLEIGLPLRELFSSELPKLLKERVTGANVVGTETLGGVRCEHLALRSTELDAQIWIDKDGHPLPRRIVLTYWHVKGEPQFWANFSDWNLSAKVPDSLFEYTPPPDSERIPFVPRKSPSDTNSSNGETP